MTISRIQPDTTLPKTPVAKTYTALITQTGTNAPTVTILNNTIGDIVWTRQSQGNYVATLNGAFPEDKTWLTIQNAWDRNLTQVFLVMSAPDTLALETSVTGTDTDGELFNTPLEIRVYK